MNRVLVDTCVVSYLFKRHRIAEQYRCHLEGRVLTISFMTVAELYRWAIKSNWGAGRRAKLESGLRNYVVIPFDNELCALWAKVMVERSRRPISCADAWIAASALRHEVPLVTHNPRDFESISGLNIITEHKEE